MDFYSKNSPKMHHIGREPIIFSDESHNSLGEDREYKLKLFYCGSVDLNSPQTHLVKHKFLSEESGH